MFRKVVSRGKRVVLVGLVVGLLLVTGTFMGSSNPSGDTIQKWLYAHNKYRSLHGVPPLNWSEDLAKEAQTNVNIGQEAWDKHWGSSLAIGYFSGPEDVVDSWYSEETFYRKHTACYTKEPAEEYFEEYGHFTRVVWKSVTKVGCASNPTITIKNGTDTYQGLWICNTDTANVKGQYTQNVKKPTKEVFPLIDEEDCELEGPDIWMRDFGHDDGKAPAIGRLYTSPDVWNRRKADCKPSTGEKVMDCTDADHQNPKAGEPNYIYVKIRNRGPKPIEEAEVRIYIANASTGLSWDKENEKGEAGDFKKLGSVSLTTEDPPLQPNEERVIGPLKWTPQDPGHFCFYLRILSEEDPITIFELASISINTSNSNNIIWRNVKIVKTSTDTAAFIVRNVREQDALVDLVFEVPLGFLQKGDLRFDLGRDLFDRWHDQSSQAEGMHPPLGTSRFQIFDTQAAIRGIPMGALEEVGVLMEFTSFSHEKATYEIVVRQEIEGEMIGGILFITHVGGAP